MFNQLKTNTLNLQEFLDKINALSSGNNGDATAKPEHLIEGETAYVNGIKLTGINPYEKEETDTAVTSQITLLTQLIELLQQKVTPAATYTIYISATEPSPDIGNDGDIYIVKENSQ